MSRGGGTTSEEEKATGWQAAIKPTATTTGEETGVGAVTWNFAPSSHPVMRRSHSRWSVPKPLRVEGVVWEDDGTRQWKPRPENEVKLPGFASIQMEALMKGILPQERQLVMVVPLFSYDMEGGAELGLAR